ncbi:MAG TPA: sensor histidine kinase [Woeseiaceae bacterium]|nr:sensor histidine kinase [Woeseiaceae bacterium]
MHVSLTDLRRLLHPAGSATPGDWLRTFSALVLIVFAAIAVTWTLHGIRTQLQQQIGESLETVAATARAGISLWVDRIEEEISVLAETPAVVAAVQERLASRSANPERGSPRRDLARILGPILRKYEYTGFAVVAPDGDWVTGSGELQGGLEAGSQPTVRSALSGEVSLHLALAEANGRTTLITAAPVRDYANRIIAALVLSLDPGKGLTDTIGLARPGITGETYIFDRHGRLLTGSRFRSEAPAGAGGDRTSARHPGLPARSAAPRIEHSAMLISLIEGPEAPIRVDVDGHYDYRGVEVLGAWTWASKLDVGIATEVDRAEAMQPYRGILTLTFLMLGAVGVSLLALLGLLVNRGRMLAKHYAFEEAARARTETLAMVSHDLRSPLNNVMLCASMISDSSDRHALDRMKSVIERSGRQMQRLVTDLLDVSDIESGRLKIARKPSDARALIDDVRDALGGEASARQVELTVDHPPDLPPIDADPDRIIQVLANLAGNALKFTPRGGRVSVSAQASADHVRFEVRDTGPGIDEDKLPHIFQQFWTTASTRSTGRGLGLYIAKTLVDYHGGRIWVETVRGQGTSFFFTIPRAHQPS